MFFFFFFFFSFISIILFIPVYLNVCVWARFSFVYLLFFALLNVVGWPLAIGYKKKFLFICFIIDDIETQSAYTYKQLSSSSLFLFFFLYVCEQLLQQLFYFYCCFSFFFLLFLFFCSITLFLSLSFSSLNVVKCVKQAKESDRHRIY